MNIQHERIQQACTLLKLDAIAREWSATADKASAGDSNIVCLQGYFSGS